MMEGILCGVFMRSKTSNVACSVITLMLSMHVNPVQAGIFDKIFGSSEAAYERGMMTVKFTVITNFAILLLPT